MTQDRYTASREVIAWAAQECEWQQSGEKSVLWMLDGWAFMRRAPGHLPGHPSISRKVIQSLGGIVEPRKNDGKSWRGCSVRVGWDVKADPKIVPRAMEGLVKVSGVVVYPGFDNEPGYIPSAISADEWFRQYEEIHPFRDGNGRTGNILWNWLRGTLDQPEMPPNLWGDPRRVVGSVSEKERP